MNAIEYSEPIQATSVVATVRPAQPQLLVGIMLVGLGTSTMALAKDDPAWMRRVSDLQTNAGASVSKASAPPSIASSGAAIHELRRLSGLTWQQLARLFKVSRRAVHLWASGKAMATDHEEQLLQVLATVKRVDRGSASANRHLLMSPQDDGTTLLDRLADGDHQTIRDASGRHAAATREPGQPSAPAHAAKAPLPPDARIGALQDRVHRDLPGARRVKRVKGRGGA